MKHLIVCLLVGALPLGAAGMQLKNANARPQRRGAANPKGSGPAATPPPPPPTVICIDPGHPSEVASGTNPQHGTNETHVAWAVALRLRKMLEAQGYAVCMTKASETELVRNRDRAAVGNRAHAALMVRLHCDASADRGYAVYYPDRQATKDNVTGPSAAIMEASARAAAAMHAAMAEVLNGLLKDGGIRGDSQTFVGGQQGGALTGSIFSEVPVVLVEMVVLSNEEDASFIKTEAGEQKMAEAIASGVRRFVDAAVNPPARR